MLKLSCTRLSHYEMNERPVDSAIRTERKRAGLRQQDIADRLGVHVSAVSGWETGEFRPDPTNARRLMELLPDLTFDDIYPAMGKAA